MSHQGDKSSSLRKLLFGSVAIASGLVACGVACVYHKFKQEVKVSLVNCQVTHTLKPLCGI